MARVCMHLTLRACCSCLGPHLQESGVIPQLDVFYWSGAGGY